MPCEKLSTSSCSQRRSSNRSSISVHARRSTPVAVDAVEAGVEAQELAGRELLVDERPIGNEAERRLRRLGLRSRSWPLTTMRPDGRLQQAGNHPHRRRLAGAVGPEEAVNLAGLNGERDAVDRRNVPYCLTRSWTAIIGPSEPRHRHARSRDALAARERGIDRRRRRSLGGSRLANEDRRRASGASSRSSTVILSGRSAAGSRPACRDRRAPDAGASHRPETG